jgi:hypothetical protein
MSQLRGPASSESGATCADDTSGAGAAQALDAAFAVWGMLVAISSPVLDAATRSRSTRELTLDETLGVLGDRPTLKFVALPRLVALTGSFPPSHAPARAVVGSRKRTRRMRAYRFKALSLEELVTPPTAEPSSNAVENEPAFERPRDGFETVKIDRIAIRRARSRRRVLVVALVFLLMLLAWSLL